MKRILVAAAAGVLFGAGLVVAELSNPVKVLNFLDITGHWDPSLVVMMAVAAGGTALGFRLVWRKAAPLCSQQFRVPSKSAVDLPLVAGATMFGMGWGLTGYCPGPAMTTLVLNPSEGVWFVGAMLAGSLLQGLKGVKTAAKP